MAMLTRLRAATTLQVAVGAIGIAILRLGSETGFVLMAVCLATEATSFAQRDVIGTSDALVSPRHLDVSARDGMCRGCVFWMDVDGECKARIMV